MMFRRIVREIINRIIGGLTRREISEVIRNKYTDPQGRPITPAEVRRQYERAERLVDVGRRMNDDPELRIPPNRLPESPFLEPESPELVAYDIIAVFDDPESGERCRRRLTVFDVDGRSAEELRSRARSAMLAGVSGYDGDGDCSPGSFDAIEIIIISGGRRPRA